MFHFVSADILLHVSKDNIFYSLPFPAKSRSADLCVAWARCEWNSNAKSIAAHKSSNGARQERQNDLIKYPIKEYYKFYKPGVSLPDLKR